MSNNDLDLLMSRIEEINRKAVTDLVPTDIDDIIRYHRTMRAKRAKGEKITEASFDVSKLIEGITGKAEEVQIVKRRI